MQKLKIFSFCVALSSVFFITYAHAASTCDYETQINLQKEAQSVNVSQEIEWIPSGEYSEDGGEYQDPLITVTVYNLTENIYAVVRNVNTNDTETFYYENTDNGTFTFQNDNGYELGKYEVIIYSDHNDCLDEEYRRISVTTPRYNSLSQFPFCYDLDEYYCQEFVDFDMNLSLSEAEELASEKRKELEEQEQRQEENKKNGFIIVLVSAIVLIIVGVTITVMIRSKRSDRK